MTLIEEMRTRHIQEIENLQEACQHLNITGWKPYYWAAGHYAYDVKVCEECGKFVESNKPNETKEHLR